MSNDTATDTYPLAGTTEQAESAGTYALRRAPRDWAISGAIWPGAAFFWFGWAQMGEALRHRTDRRGHRRRREARSAPGWSAHAPEAWSR